MRNSVVKLEPGKERSLPPAIANATRPNSPGTHRQTRGSQTRVDAIEIRWLSGVTGKFENIAADRFYQVIEGQAHLVDLTVTKR